MVKITLTSREAINELLDKGATLFYSKLHVDEGRCFKDTSFPAEPYRFQGRFKNSTVMDGAYHWSNYYVEYPAKTIEW